MNRIVSKTGLIAGKFLAPHLYLLLLLTSCSPALKIFKTASSGLNNLPGKQPSPQLLISRAKERKEKFSNLKGIVYFSLSSPAKSIKFKGVLILTQDLFYLEGLSPLGQTISYVLLSEEKITIYYPGSNLAYQGKNSPRNISRILGFELRFQELINLLIAYPFEDNLAAAIQDLIPKSPPLSSSGRAEYCYQPNRHSLSPSIICFDPELLLASRIVSYDLEGEKILEILYGNYKKRNDFYLPFSLELDFLREEVSLKLRYKRAAVNRMKKDLPRIKVPFSTDTEIRAIEEIERQ